MTDRLTTAVDALDRVPVPMSWSDVQRRLDQDGSASDDGVTRLPDPVPSRDGVTHAIGWRRGFLVAVVVVLIAGVTAIVAWPTDGDDPVRTGPGPTTLTAPDPAPTTRPTATSTPAEDVTATTQPAEGTGWGSAVEVWTGSEYLVWSGQVGGDGRGRADGWRFDPATGTTRDIPIAPIAPRDSAAGVWTGTTLLVCCGNAVGEGPAYDTVSAAAYDPAADTWQPVAPPPAGAAGYTVGAAWSGSEMLVVVQLGDPGAEAFGNKGLGLYAYDPVTDTWDERAKPIWGDRFGEVVWTGDRLVIWSQRAPGVDGGVVYDPAADRWSWLPELPKDAPVYYGSAAWVDGQLVVFGQNGNDETTTVGYRLRLGDVAWRRMAVAPLPPIEWYDGTPGSQTLATDEATGRVIVYPTHGYESGGGGVEGVPPPPLLAYDPEADAWTKLGDLGGSPYEPDLIVGGDVVLTPDRADPEAFRLEP